MASLSRPNHKAPAASWLEFYQGVHGLAGRVPGVGFRRPTYPPLGGT